MSGSKEKGKTRVQELSHRGLMTCLKVKIKFYSYKIE